MKSTKQIREQFDLITEKEEKEGQKLSALVRAGLYDAKKLPALKKALEKSADKMTSQEKRMLLNLLDSLISQVVSDDQVYRKVRQNVHSMNEAKEDYLSKFDPRFKAGYPSDKDIPSVLILKRKAIRVYPDNQKVALYYSQALDKYVTIPFSDIQLGVNEEIGLAEETSVPKAISKKHSGITDYLNEEEDGYNYDPAKENQKKFSKLSGASSGKTVKNYISRRKKLKSAPKGNWQVKPEPGNYTVNKIKDKAETFARAATGDIGDVVGLTDPKRGEGLRKFNPGAAQAGDLAGAALTIGTGPSRATVKGAGVVSSTSKLADKVADATKTSDKVADATKASDKVADATKAATKTKKGKGKFSTARNLTQKVLRLAGRATKLGLAGLAGAAGAAGENDNSYVLSKNKDPQVGKSALFKSGSGFSQAQDAKKATAERSRQAQVNALTTEEEYVLSKNKDPQFGKRELFKKKRSSLPVDPKASTNEKIRQKQLATLTTNESVIDTLRNMVDNNIQEAKLSFNEKEITINKTVAKKLLNVYESINKSNKNKMEQMLNESATSFNKVLTFAVRQ